MIQIVYVVLMQDCYGTYRPIGVAGIHKTPEAANASVNKLTEEKKGTARFWMDPHGPYTVEG